MASPTPLPQVILTRSIGEKTATRMRGAVTVVLDVQGTPDPDALFVLSCMTIAGGIETTTETFPIVKGENTVAFAFDIPPAYGDDFRVALAAKCLNNAGVDSAWAHIEVTQCDLLLDSSGSVATSPLTMTPLTVVAQGNGGSGGSHIPKTGTLATATTIELIGYYPADAGALNGQTEFYAPRWYVDADYVAVTPVAIPIFDGTYPSYEGMWGWTSSDSFKDNLPADQWSICKVTIDGGAPVFALLCNAGGV